MTGNANLTFAEKIFKATAGAIVFARPDIILTHDNTASILNTYKKMGGKSVLDPEQLLVVLDHNAPPADAKLATQYQEIRDFVSQQGIKKFYDSGFGICHQIISYHAMPGMLIVGSDSHTSTAGAFNTFAAGIDRTEAAGIWKRGETWFRVPESIKIMLKGSLQKNVSAKDLALWIVGMIGSDGANYMSVEYHGDGLKRLSISDRMVLANLASEMGAKNAVFPSDEILYKYYNRKIEGIWADKGAIYNKEIEIDLDTIFPVVAAPHHVDNILSVADASGVVVHEGLIGTCTNGRIEDLRIASDTLRGKTIREGFQLNVIPASRKIFLEAIEEGIISILIEAGANVLTPSCGPCLGTGQGIPANGHTVISTANRNFSGRMGNKDAKIYLASPATVASSALTGVITDPRELPGNEKFPYKISQSEVFRINDGDIRLEKNVWDYSDVDNLNTDLMFAGKHTYNILSTDAEAIMAHLFEDFDPEFSRKARKGDIIIAGENFGCGSSREHPSVGFAHAGIKAIIVKSVNRIFFRSSINQGLVLIVHKEAVNSYKRGKTVSLNLMEGEVVIGSEVFKFKPLPEKLKQIIDSKGLINYMKVT
jgi:3-isopropylmalate/(R)-2-methylmalate dehydratase large subunit